MTPCSSDFLLTAQLFKALAHPQRLRIACQLLEGECPSQKQLVEEMGLPQSSVARLLEPLRQCGLVVGVREGTELHIRVQGQVLGPMLVLVRDWLQNQETLNGRSEPSPPKPPSRLAPADNDGG
jgi:DNA-binding transcriptional ArsR family regulator